ncbi:MAG TPA: glycosyltransferase family 9 protein [Chitinophagaceae bacterium]|nr:glycosyltransferase family 9 protein [Chitinophagaceae bacterium]
MKKFLIIQTAFIGDVVLATALVEKLHHHFPEATIDFLLRKGNEVLLKEHPHVNKVLVWDKKGGKYKDLYRLWKDVRRSGYDHVINVQRFAATGWITAFSGARETIGFDKNPFSIFFSKSVKHIISTEERPLHETERNQLLVEHLTGRVPAKPRLYPSASDLEKVAPFKNGPYICIAPASVWFTKQYPKEKWISLLDKVNAALRIYIIGAPSDSALADEIRGNCSTKERIFNLCGKLSLLQSAALQKDAVRNIVNDSGPMHFASAVNAPVTAIYCSTVPSFGYGPLSDDSAIVQTTVSLSCKPCGLHGHAACPQQHFKCALTIGDDQVLATISQSADPPIR